MLQQPFRAQGATTIYEADKDSLLYLTDRDEKVLHKGHMGMGGDTSPGRVVRVSDSDKSDTGPGWRSRLGSHGVCRALIFKVTEPSPLRV